MWQAVKIKVRGKNPKTLKLTQKLSEKFRQTISLIAASNKKNNPQLSVILSQALSFNVIALPSKYLKIGLLRKKPMMNTKAKIAFKMVGLILIKIGFCKYQVKNPKNPKITAEHSGTKAIFLSFIVSIAKEMTLTITKAIVAVISSYFL